MRNGCQKLIEYLSINDNKKFSDSMKQHLKECKDCATEWKNYKQMIKLCHSFPKLMIPNHLQESLNAIPSTAGKDKNSRKIRSNRFEHFAAVAAVLIVFSIFMYFAISSAPVVTTELPVKGDKWLHKAYSKILSFYYKKEVIMGDIQYMSLPATIKISEFYDSLSKDKMDGIQNKGEKNGSEKMEGNK